MRDAAQKHTASHHHCKKSANQQRACVSLDIGVATSDQHKVALAGISCLQCILPHPEVLHRSTQPAIITARSTGAQPARSATLKRCRTYLRWLPYLACNAFFPFQRCCTHALTSTQPAITPTEGAPSIKHQASTRYELAHLHNTKASHH